MAAAAEKGVIYYDTLTELDHDAKELIKHDFDPDVAYISPIVKIFSNRIPIDQLKSTDERPLIIITAGSPGVGKSTIAKEQFIYYGIEPNKVYTISMDALLEHNSLFRTKTKILYNKWHNKMANENYATFSGISTAAYSAKQANLKIPEKIANINSKFSAKYGAINKGNNENLINSFQKLRVTKKSRISPVLSFSPRKSSPELQRNRTPSPKLSPRKSPVLLPKRAPTPPTNTTRRRSSRLAAQKPKQGGAITRNLDDIREVGFEFGVANGLNILYDCTLTSTGRRMQEIMKILQKYAKMGHPKYRIKVLLIEADKNINKAAEIIQERIRGRHHKMVENGFLRGLTLSMGAIKGMIKTNREGFETAISTYGEKIVNPPYDPSDFYFEEILNLPKNM